MDITVKDGIVYAPISKGLEFRLPVLLSNGMAFSDFTNLQADFKPTQKLSGDALISLTLGDGIESSGEQRDLVIDEDVTATIKPDTLYMDLKAWNVGSPTVLIIECVCPVLPTVTNNLS
jgi:hypothetical protein